MTKQELRKLIRETIEEALTLKKFQDKVIVSSDLETRQEQSKETFKNKEALKKAGFKWDKELNSWTTDASDFSNARSVIMGLNKVETFIEKIEDLPDFIQNADNLNRKDELSQKIEAFIKNLTDELDEKTASAEIRDFLNFQAKLRKRSVNNTLLIWIQNRNATHVEGFNVWRDKFGRQVKKGAKAITIFAPITIKKDEEGSSSADADLDTKVKKHDFTYFKAVSVFDIKDTDPIPGKENLYVQTPDWHADNTPNEKADKLFNYSSKVAEELGIRVERGDARGGEMGYAAGDHINITSTIEGANRAGTMIHEIAHELLHFKKTSIFYIDAPLTKEDKEIQAESVSYIVLRHYDLPAQHQTTYLALWKANKEALQRNLGAIKKVADFIIQKIDEVAAEDPSNKDSQPEQK
jgi:hypothetical protein